MIAVAKNQMLSFYTKFCAKCRKRCLNWSFADKNQQVLPKLVLGLVMLGTSGGPVLKKGHQTHTIFYVTTGSVTHHLSEMYKYGKTKGE